jgi:carboxymethylenebutenolidase
MNVPALVEAMERFNKSFEYKMYPGAAHAFFNDTGANYSAEAAQQAWQVTLSFLSNNLKTGR